MRLETWHYAEEKLRWKVVRRDTFVEVPGDIISADEETGECVMRLKDGTQQTFPFGPQGIRLIRK